jgi:hypothetical protein
MGRSLPLTEQIGQNNLSVITESKRSHNYRKLKIVLATQRLGLDAPVTM